MCNYPLQNDGESSGHETEDTVIVAIFANLKDANKRAMQEKECDYDSEEDHNDDDDYSSLFYWQDDEPCEWTDR